MKKSILLLLSIVISINSFSIDKPAYKIIDNTGKEVTYQQMVDAISKADVIFFGEYHDNPISHWLELEVTKSLYNVAKQNLVLSAEMFESDNQLVVDEFLKGFYPVKKLEEDARLWPNYRTDYKPLLMFAKKNKLKFVAANIPRRYASVVYKKGFEALNDLPKQAKEYIAPLPIKYDPELKCYKDMLQMSGMHSGMSKGMKNLPKSQAIKDATMAYFINKNIKKGTKLIHYNGSYHSDYKQGTVWYLQKLNKNLKIVNITTALSETNDLKINDSELQRADYIIVVPDDMTRTQ